MILDCVELLGLTQTCDFWGDSINYRNVQNYSAKARVSGDPNLTSILPAWSNQSGVMAFTSGYMPIYVQGVFLGSGKITQLSFDGGIDVNYKPFSVNFEILKSGDLSYVTGELYTGIVNTFAFLPYLNSLTEQCEYSQSNNKTVDFTRNISFGLEKGYTNQITGAHTLSVAILSCLTELGVYYPLPPPHYTGVEGMVKNISQNIDTINGNFSYSEAYSYQSGVPWIHEYEHSLEYGSDGITTVSENGNIQANRRLNGSGERITYALSGWAVVQTGIYPRVNDVFGRWADQFQASGGCELSLSPFQKSFTKDYPRGLVSYNYSYNNDPAGAQSGFYHSYEQTINSNDLGWLNVGVNGELRANQTEPSGALDFLYLKYTGEIKPNIQTYAQDAYSSSINYFKSPFCATGYAGTLALLNSEETYGEPPAKINYNFDYTDDPSYISTGIFRKIKNTVSNQEITPLVNIFRIANYLEMPQNSYQANLGTLSNNIEIIGDPGVTISQYKTAASGRIITPTGTYWIASNTYNFNPFTREFSMDVSYLYEGYRAINDYIL